LGAIALISLVVNAAVMGVNSVLVYFIIGAGRVFNASKVYASYEKLVGVV
jgi:hypothetical protein